MRLPLLRDTERVRRFEAALHESSICHTVASLFTQTRDSSGKNGAICSNLIVLVAYKRTAETARYWNCTTKPANPQSVSDSAFALRDIAGFAIIPIFGGLLN